MLAWNFSNNTNKHIKCTCSMLYKKVALNNEKCRTDYFQLDKVCVCVWWNY